MGSFWNIFGKDGEEGAAGADGSDHALVPADQAPGVQPQPTQSVAGQVPPPLPQSLPPQLPAKATPARYGIDDAIKLMRTLPVDENVELVVRVIKHTLASLNVQVTDIVTDAISRQESLRTSINDYGKAIQEFEREIDARRQEIMRLEQEYAETTSVRERLELAEAASTGTPPRTKPVVVKKTEPPPVPMTPRSVPPAPFRPKLSADSKAPAVPPSPGSPGAPLDPKVRAELAKTLDHAADSDKQLPVAEKSATPGTAAAPDDGKGVEV
jgi:hypothetical protein